MSSVVRLVLDGPAKPDSGVDILLEAFRRWPRDLESDYMLVYMITPGGFMEFPLPDSWSGCCGCHDLNIFSPRAKANRKPGSPRSRRAIEMKSKVSWKEPDVVLHHPHATDTPMAWQLGWSGLVKEFEPVVCASAIGYYSYEHSTPRCTLKSVLDGTHPGTEVCDIVIDTSPYRSRPGMYMR